MRGGGWAGGGRAGGDQLQADDAADDPGDEQQAQDRDGLRPGGHAHSTVSAAPVPVHTAYAVLIGMCRST